MLTLLVGMDGSHISLKMFAPGEPLVPPLPRAPIHPHILLHATLHDEHGRRRHPTSTRLFGEVRHGHRRTQTRISRGALSRGAVSAAHAHVHATGTGTSRTTPRARHRRPALHKVRI